MRLLARLLSASPTLVALMPGFGKTLAFQAISQVGMTARASAAPSTATRHQAGAGVE